MKRRLVAKIVRECARNSPITELVRVAGKRFALQFGLELAFADCVVFVQC